MAIANCEVRDFGLTSQTYTDHAAISIDSNADFVYSLDGDSTNSDLYPIVDSAGTIPVTTTSTGNEFPIEMIAFAAIGVVLVLLVVVALLKRRN